jgi:hypothetical protein
MGQPLDLQPVEEQEVEVGGWFYERPSNACTAIRGERHPCRFTPDKSHAVQLLIGPNNSRSSPPMPPEKSSVPSVPRPRRGRPGVQLEDVCAAADALLAEGLKPTIERVRRHLGGGSPNTVSALLDDWFAQLPTRLVGAQTAGPSGQPRSHDDSDLPLSVAQAARQFWDVARREADQAQLQATEATRRELELQREALVQKDAELQQREASFEQSRVKLDEALAASRQALGAMQAQMERRSRSRHGSSPTRRPRCGACARRSMKPWPARRRCARRPRWN